MNGAGTVLTTEQCLLNQNRNPQLGKADIEGYLEEYLNVSKVIWLSSGIEGDDTDGHVDDFARFVSPSTVLCAHSRSDLGGNRSVLERNLRTLREATDQDGRPLEVWELPMPDPIQLPEEERFLPASYANFYIGNEVVLVPVFKDANDAAGDRADPEPLPRSGGRAHLRPGPGLRLWRPALRDAAGTGGGRLNCEKGERWFRKGFAEHRIQRNPPITAAKLMKFILVAPHTGHCQSSGRSSKDVPGGMPRSGSPASGS